MNSFSDEQLKPTDNIVVKLTQESNLFVPRCFIYVERGWIQWDLLHSISCRCLPNIFFDHMPPSENGFSFASFIKTGQIYAGKSYDNQSMC